MKPYYHPEKGVPGVRFATPEDEEQIFALLMLLHSENGWFGVNDQKVRDGIKIGTRRQGGFIWVVDEGWFAPGRPRVVATAWHPCRRAARGRPDRGKDAQCSF